jgi:hypothetical protein
MVSDEGASPMQIAAGLGYVPVAPQCRCRGPATGVLNRDERLDRRPAPG